MASLILIFLICWVFFLDQISTYLVFEHLSKTKTHFFLRLCISLFLTSALLFILYKEPVPQSMPELLFVSLIGITLFTDARVMLISQLVTVYTIPIAFFLCVLNMCSISLTTSIIGALFGYMTLKIVSLISSKTTGKRGLGEGDIDLLAMIGAYTGPLGCWASLLIGSLLGTLFGIILFATGTTRTSLKLPFGAFLGIGAILFIIFSESIYSLWSI